MNGKRNIGVRVRGWTVLKIPGLSQKTLIPNYIKTNGIDNELKKIQFSLKPLEHCG